MLMHTNRLVRVAALAAAAFVAAAAGHETVLGVAHALLLHGTDQHSLPQHSRGPHQDHACALCELAGTPTLVTLAVELSLPQVSLELGNLASSLTPAVRDESCFPHFRRGPPALSIV